VAEVARRMAELKVGAILVLRDGQLRGVFSERDLMVRVVVPGLDPAATLVAQVMSTQIMTIAEDAPLEEAKERMRSHNCRHLPVLNGQRVTGFLSMRDLMNFELASKDEELHHMRAYIHGTA
jgi:CBS domain-containing protein